MADAKILKPIYSGKKIIMPDEAMALLDEMEEEAKKKKEISYGIKVNDAGARDSKIGKGNRILTKDMDIKFVENARYDNAVNELREACIKDPNSKQPLWACKDGSTIPRPFSISELLRLKVEDFETHKDREGNERPLEDRLRTFNKFNDTCSAILYSGDGFKLVQLYKRFIVIERGEKEEYRMLISIQDFSETDAPVIREEDGIYNKYLTKNQIMDNELWRQASNDIGVLDAYSDIVLSNIKMDHAMKVILCYEAGVQPLCVSGLDETSDIICNVKIYDPACLLRVFQRPENSEGGNRK